MARVPPSTVEGFRMDGRSGLSDPLDLIPDAACLFDAEGRFLRCTRPGGIVSSALRAVRQGPAGRTGSIPWIVARSMPG